MGLARQQLASYLLWQLWRPARRESVYAQRVGRTSVAADSRAPVLIAVGMICPWSMASRTRRVIERAGRLRCVLLRPDSPALGGRSALPPAENFRSVIRSAFCRAGFVQRASRYTP
jgi:hypothetical protein